MEELGVSAQGLEKLSNAKIIDIGKYNFHLDVISLQVLALEQRQRASTGISP